MDLSRRVARRCRGSPDQPTVEGRVYRVGETRLKGAITDTDSSVLGGRALSIKLPGCREVADTEPTNFIHSLDPRRAEITAGYVSAGDSGGVHALVICFNIPAC